MKDTKLHIYMLYPFFLFLLAFGFDKLFFIGHLPDYFLKTASFVNYDYDQELLDELELYLKKPDRKKVLVIFGNSRTISFDNAYIAKKHPGWILFNFSVPGGTSDYFAYYMEQFRDRDVRPDMVYFTVSPQGFNTTPAIAMDEVMLYGLSPWFIVKNITHYSLDETLNYLAKSVFWTARNKPRLNVIVRRLKNDSMEAKGYNEFLKFSHQKLVENKGSASFYDKRAPIHESADFLLQDGRNAYNAYYIPFNFSHGQLFFTRQCLKIAYDLHVPAALLRARVGPELRRLVREKPVVARHRENNSTYAGKSAEAIWLPFMEDLVKRYHSKLYDLNHDRSFKCDMFYDTSHMAAICFPEFTDYLIQKAQRSNKPSF